jgi:hypothetical protein
MNNFAMLFARPFLKLLHKSTGPILVEMFAMTSVAVRQLAEPRSEYLLCQKHISLEHFLNIN